LAVGSHHPRGHPAPRPRHGHTFERWITTATSPDCIIADIARNFESATMAAAIALALRKATSTRSRT
jgi:hypothetical protein